MQSNHEYQLLKLKVASEIVRCSQAVVAFSRAFYLEEVLVDKINNEIKDVKEQYGDFQERIDNLLKSAHLEDNIVTETNLRVLCSTIQSELDGREEMFEDFGKRTLQAKARRQAKSSLLQELSTNELMSKFESLTLSELRDVHVPEFSWYEGFINESDFGLLEKLNEDWTHFRKDLMIQIKSNLAQIEAFKLEDLNSYRNLEKSASPCSSSHNAACGAGNISTKMNGHHSKNSSLTEDEIGKAFANRSGSVLRKFSTLLRRGRKSSKTLSTGSFDLTES